MTGWLIDTFLVTAALIALVLMIRRPVARAFGPGMAYALWVLPLLRLLLPPLVLPARPVPVEISMTADTVHFTGPLPIAGAPAFSLPDVVFVLWLTGALAFLIWRAWGYTAMRRRLLKGARAAGEVGNVRLIETAAAPSPIAFGVRDKVIALPIGFMDLPDRAARDLAIAHELEHHAGRDLAANIAVQPLLALHWFNPLAWIGWCALRRDQEAACDARVLAGCDSETRSAYGRLIASFAGVPRLGLAAPMACAIVREKSIIHRLRSLTMNEPTPRRRLAGRVLIAFGALALPLTASISYASVDAPLAPPAPTAGAAPHTESRVMIVEHHGAGEADVSMVHTRVVTRDGKTIIIKTDKALSDAEVEERVARAEAELPLPPAPPETPAVPGARKTAQTHQIIIMQGNGTGSGDAMAFASGGEGKVCAEGSQASTIDVSDNTEGKRQIVKLRFCGHGSGKVQALEAIRKARASLSADENLSPAIREKVLRQLDVEIERLAKNG